MRHLRATVLLLVGLLATLTLVPKAAAQVGWTLIGWNDLGMHCMDADFSALAILPPYNTIHAQLLDPTGTLVTNPTGITVTYEAVADPDGSFNSTSTGGKTDFWNHVQALFKVNLTPDQGLAGFGMPGVSNTPQTMRFDADFSWFTAEGIPLTPYDNAHNKNTYPLMRLVARDSSGNVLATTDIVLPISDEMSCRDCHSSQSGPAAEPAAGWVNNSNDEVDYRLNILLLHDEYQSGSAKFGAALVSVGYNPLGLYATATSDGRPVLCADCHGSNALPGTGVSGIPALTQAIHSRHAGVTDPNTGMTLGSSSNRSACYECHPGSATRCLRGAMGHAVATDGSLAMQCQSCHGTMSAVGESIRRGWFEEPACQQCHTGTATHNNGQIRFTSVFDSSGQPRVAVDNTFATNPDTPANGFSLYRFSSGHGGLQCEACHGSTHAVFPSADRNDNIQSSTTQGHVGTLVECSACHGTSPQTTSGGPHGMHPVGQSWVGRHGDSAEHTGTSGCRSCHGLDYRGTVLSRSAANRTISTEHGSKSFWRGFQIGCYTCHNGPSSESWNSNRAPITADLSASTTIGNPVTIALSATDPDGDPLQLRVVSQPQYGTVGLSGKQAVYYPDGAFAGETIFTYAAWDGSTDSNLSTVTVTVGGGAPPCTVSCSASAPASGQVGSAIAFTGGAIATNCQGSVSYDWSFGDGSPGSSQQSPSHTYSVAGSYAWTMTASVGGQTCAKSGTITVSPAPICSVTALAEVTDTAQMRRNVEFRGNAQTEGCSGEPSYRWNFGDGTAAVVGRDVLHAYKKTGTYTWTLSVTVSGSSSQTSGSITITPRSRKLLFGH